MNHSFHLAQHNHFLQLFSQCKVAQEGGRYIPPAVALQSRLFETLEEEDEEVLALPDGPESFSVPIIHGQAFYQLRLLPQRLSYPPPQLLAGEDPDAVLAAAIAEMQHQLRRCHSRLRPSAIFYSAWNAMAPQHVGEESEQIAAMQVVPSGGHSVTLLHLLRFEHRQQTLAGQQRLSIIIHLPRHVVFIAVGPFLGHGLSLFHHCSIEP
mmetsp:Transcript_12227/g.42633  ORF Transcript_12227/g.42633 Transcript_12227/m.42633 type:complete len:209 (-) Transcript_12227:96-722(-)